MSRTDCVVVVVLYFKLDFCCAIFAVQRFWPTGYGPRMAEGKTVNVIPLNGSNYGTWKLQCRMALVRDGLWGIVNGTETAPTDGGERRSKFLARRDTSVQDYRTD